MKWGWALISTGLQAGERIQEHMETSRFNGFHLENEPLLRIGKPLKRLVYCVITIFTGLNAGAHLNRFGTKRTQPGLA